MTGKPGRAGADIAALSGRPIVFCGRALGLHHQTVQCCVERAVVEGPLAALDDRPRQGRAPTITLEAKAWLVSVACSKAKEFGYPHELWTTRLLAHHAREHGPAQGHACLANLAQGTVCKIVDQDEVKPHKVRFYLEQRDPDFAEKMAGVLSRLSPGENPQAGSGRVEDETAEQAGGDHPPTYQFASATSFDYEHANKKPRKAREGQGGPNDQQSGGTPSYFVQKALVRRREAVHPESVFYRGSMAGLHVPCRRFANTLADA